ncbi:MAG TPA: DUF1501 domain-containing protein [Micromonosporaceae bacterium]|nr:DUF1501 domain-containing protein [Micromonosporaceae bacterium]
MTELSPGRHRGRYVARHRATRGRSPAADRDELLRHGPNEVEAALRLAAEQVRGDLYREKERWRKGFTRRRVIAGAGAVGVAALGTQLVTAKYSFAAPGTTNRTLVVIFLRGGMDGLSVVVPAGDANLRRARPNIGIQAGALLQLDNRFGLHPALEPLLPFWEAGQMTAVHAVASPDASRSHFQAQECLERGTASTSTHTGWLDRTLSVMGPGTTFRAIAEGDATPRSLIGPESKLVLDGIERFALSGWRGVREKTMAALEALYTGFDHPAVVHAMTTVKALGDARRIADAGYEPAADYGGGGFANRLKDVARLIKARVGLRVATLDVGGWDMHTGLGNVDGGEMRNHLTELGRVLSAFATDLGPQLADVTLVTMTEFGRRVAENGNAGTDHGHGSLMLLLGGGLVGGRVHGKWPGLAPDDLDNGDLAGANDYRDVLGEILERRFGLGDLKKIFPDHDYHRIGVLQ